MNFPEIIQGIRAFLIGPDFVRIPMTFAIATILFLLAAFLFYRDRQKIWFVSLAALSVCSLLATLVAYRTLSAPRIAHEPNEIFAIQGFPNPDITEIDCNAKWKKDDAESDIFWPNDPAVRYDHRFTTESGDDSVAFASITFTSAPDIAYFYRSVDAECRKEFGNSVRQREVVTMTKSSKAFLCKTESTKDSSYEIIVPIKVDPIHFTVISAKGSEEKLGVNLEEYFCLSNNIKYLSGASS